MIRRNKYGAKKVKVDGYTFDSQAEYARYCELKLMQKAKAISNLEVHPVYEFKVNGRPLLIRSKGFPNGRRATFKPDFMYTKDGTGIIVEDVKSRPTVTEAYRLRRALFEALYYPIRVEEIFMDGRMRR